MSAKPNVPVTAISPPAVDVISKVIQVVRTDTTAFDAFVLPKNAVPIGAYVVGNTVSNAATTAVIQVGTVPGTTNELVNSFDVKTNGAGYFAVGAAGGSGLGNQLAADTLFKARYAETGTASTAGGPWEVKIEYYIPQTGFSY